MVIHTDEEFSDLEISPGIQFSTDSDAVQQLVRQNNCPMKFFVGYAGWGPGQLEGEMEEGSWLTTDATDELVFNIEDPWLDIMRQLRTASTAWINPKCAPEDPSNN